MSRKKKKTSDLPSNTQSRNVITGWWDGEPIWRKETAEEKLFQELAKRNPKLLENLKKNV